MASYYENRLATGTYEVEVRSQYTSNNVESFGLKKTVSIEADPGLPGKTPAELADPAYSEYKEPTTNPTTTAENETTPVVETTPYKHSSPCCRLESIAQTCIFALPYSSYLSIFLIILTQQKIRQMHDLDTVDVARGQFVQRHHIFRVMIFDLK